jgi:hypothetical protein
MKGYLGPFYVKPSQDLKYVSWVNNTFPFKKVHIVKVSSIDDFYQLGMFLVLSYKRRVNFSVFDAYHDVVMSLLSSENKKDVYDSFFNPELLFLVYDGICVNSQLFPWNDAILSQRERLGKSTLFVVLGSGQYLGKFPPDNSLFNCSSTGIV